VPYLLDTNVVSELRKAKPDKRVLAWHKRHTASHAFLSTLVIGEIRQGIERLRGRDEVQAAALETWLDGLLAGYRERILPVTVEVAQEWGRLSASSRPPVVDGLMAATAKVHRLVLVTRNVDDVAGTGVAVVNPFAEL
jgi:predicted nucleic acid-binding protein